MLCGLQIPSFHRKAKRVRPVISAPLPQGLDSMNNNTRANNADGTESGVYYLGTKPGTGEKHLIKRSRPPPTETSPLDDGFDAYTTQTGVGSRFPVDSEEQQQQQQFLSRSRSQGASASESSPKAVLNRTMAYDVSSVSSRRPPLAHKSETTYPSMTRRVQLPRADSDATHVVPQQNHQAETHAAKGKSRENVKETFREYQDYMKEMEKMFSKHGDFDISINRVNDISGMRESVALGRVQSSRSTTNRYHGRPMLGDSSPARNNTSTSTQSRVPKARQTYEEVSRRVIENTPEKTVTISTWREQVAKEASDVERMSVYYYTQRDMQEYERSLADDLQRGPSSSGGSGRAGAVPTSHYVDHRISRSEGQKSCVTLEDEPGLRKETILAPNPIQSHKAFARSPEAQKLSNKSSEKQALSFSSSSLSSSTSHDDSSGELPPTPPPKPPRLSIKTTADVMQSTPIDNHVPMPSFHPTKNGSIISTIRSTSSAFSLTFESVLGSCKPSLTHLAPVLQKLGITSVEHLRALAGLNPDIRDRELKDDALRLGITAMEWAILVDRLRLL